MKYTSLLTYHFQNMANVEVFGKWVKRNTHVKCESPITQHSKDMAYVKVFEKLVKRQGHKVKTNGTIRKFLS